LAQGLRVIIQDIVAEHADEAPFLWSLRDLAVSAPNYALEDLAELDERVEAHLDGLRLAGPAGWELCVEQLANEEPGEVFVAAVLALESRSPTQIQPVLTVAEEVPETTRGFISALGWVTPQQLKGTGKTFLNGGSPFMRRLGIAACALHRVDPGPLLEKALSDEDPALKARALRAVGELGREDLQAEIRIQFRTEEDEACGFWAAWSSVLLGERNSALERLKVLATADSPFAARALQLVPRALDAGAAQAWLKGLVQGPKWLRTVIGAVGARGDPHFLPWLIKQMGNQDVARGAGEAFSMITGLDLALENLEAEEPEEPENPEDEDIALDPDEDLPWPAPDLIEAWWSENKGRFQAGTRYLAGQPVTAAHCRQVLATGFQRQRNAAALELALLEPGKPLFETRAQGIRQQKLLGLKG
jgi:uncharacterized protein (TIGR02270 family)